MKIIGTTQLKFYIIQNTDGLFYNGWKWIDDITKAKVWNKLSTVRCKNTMLYQTTGQFNQIIEIFGGDYKIHNDEERIQNSINQRKIEELNRLKSVNQKRKQWLELELNKIQNELEKL